MVEEEVENGADISDGDNAASDTEAKENDNSEEPKVGLSAREEREGGLSAAVSWQKGDSSSRGSKTKN